MPEAWEREKVITGTLFDVIIHKGLIQLSQHEGPDRDNMRNWDCLMLDRPSAEWIIEVLKEAIATGTVDPDD
jgi:hypothetical protein